jgi:hypothetical protein
MSNNDKFGNDQHYLSKISKEVFIKTFLKINWNEMRINGKFIKTGAT